MEEHFEINHRRWEEAVQIHVKSTTGVYGVPEFRAGADVLGQIESEEVGDVSDKSLVHLQCHFGLDTLCLARRGAIVTGLDFSGKAIEAARALSAETGVAGTFVEGNVYDAAQLVSGAFDIVYVTWGAINWLPDIEAWATVVAHFLKPGGYLYLLEAHPAAMMLEEMEDGTLVPTYPYFQGRTPLTFDESTTYTGDPDRLKNTRTCEWNHSLSSIVNALIGVGLRLDFLNEHDRLVWKAFPSMISDGQGFEVLPPGVPSVPLAFSLKASRP